MSKAGDKININTTVFGDKPVRCCAIVCDPMHPEAGGYFVKTLEATDWAREGQLLWVDADIS